MVDFNHFKNVYFEECNELLNTSEENLLELQSGNHNPDRIHAVFRSIHSIKGGAGSFGFHNLIGFAHQFETLLDALRNNQILLTADLCEILLRANDVLSDLVQLASVESEEPPLQMYNVKSQLAEILETLLPHESKVQKEAAITTENNRKFLYHYHIEFIPKPELMKFGNEPRFILNELIGLQSDKVEDGCAIVASIDKLPSFEDLDWSLCYLSWQIDLQSQCALSRVKEAFEFVEDDCALHIKVVNQVLLEDDIAVEPESVAVATIAEQNGAGVMTKETKAETVLVKLTDTKTAPKALQTQKEEVAHSIRVELDRIDRLVNTVGEMVIKQAMLLDQAQALNIDSSHALAKGLQDLTHHMRDLQEYVMAIRAQPVKTVFTRMPRLVRELSLELNKDIHLETFGENTEIDKTVIERLGEPLTHMIRNAIDHGIEPSDKRSQLGKPAHGTIRLSAEHKSGRIVIEMSDDGGGINRNKVLQKAINQGLIGAESTLSGEEIDNLIFLPGFSTAESVTNISGRGVGMDVVKKSIQSLGGRIAIQSNEGKGCKFTLTLPLTLAVLDGMIVSCGSQLYIIPLINIIETIRPSRNQISLLVGCHDILNLRTNTIPLLYLHEIFDIPNAINWPCCGRFAKTTTSCH